MATAIWYVESSALVAALLEHDTAAMERAPAGTRLVTSALTLAETARAIVRARVAGRLTAQQEQAAVMALRTFTRRCFILDVDGRVVSRVGRRFPVEPIRTLDAVHLATADLLETPQLVTIVTRDARVRENAVSSWGMRSRNPDSGHDADGALTLTDGSASRPYP